MTIASILESRASEVISIPLGTPVSEAVALLAARRIGAVPVMDGDQVAGILSERDVLYCLAAEGAGLLSRRVEEVMTAPPITVAPDAPILSALSLMTKRRIRHLPVIAGGALVGFVSIGDLVKKRIDRIEEEAEAMRSYIQSA
jgi:CBS domain-containing protein